MSRYGIDTAATPCHTGSMLLTDALAAALHQQFDMALCLDPDDGCTMRADYWTNNAAAVLRGPTFREALTTALAEAIDDYEIPNRPMSYDEAKRAVAAAIVERLLPETAA